MLLRRLGAFLVDILQIVIFAVSIFLFIYLLVLQPHRIKGSSMEPNFQDKQYLLTDKVSYRFGDPKRGDVVVFKAPPDDKDEFIKRIIGLPGEQVMIRQGKVYINNKELKENYLTPGQFTAAGSTITEGKTFTIPVNQYLLLGDNRDHSFDSRNFPQAFVDRSKLNGRAWVVYWPIPNAGVVPGVNY